MEKEKSYKHPLAEELFQLTKLSGMSGVNNKYIKSMDLVQESASLLGQLPGFSTKEEYLKYMNNMAIQNNFYAYLSNKYNITSDQAKTRFLSYSNLYNLLFIKPSPQTD